MDETLPMTTVAIPSAGAALALDDWAVLRARGADATSFLQSQLTNDIEHLPADRASLAGYCSAKGRLLATFVVWRGTQDEWLLACSADLAASVLRRLSMYVLRAKCKLDDASAEVPLWGVVGDGAAASLGERAPRDAWQLARADAATWIRLPAAKVGGASVPRWLCAGADPSLAPLDRELWAALEVQSGVPRIVAATVEQFVPQMVNLELVGGVSFGKGCYPGQEVVARSQYRGTAKRRAQIVAGAADAALAPGTEIFHSADASQPAGQVVLAGRVGDRCIALAELKLAALAGGTLTAGSAAGPVLVLQPLPYALPAAEAAA